MKKQNKIEPSLSILRSRAEKLVNNKQLETGSHLTDAETLRLVHELQVQQIELELQNEELEKSKEEAEIASQKYTELYDFAPSGFFTLSNEGMIVELNLRGANMLGKQRTFLINSIFTLFVSADTKTVFDHFLQKIFSRKTKQSCEVTLNLDDKLPVYVFIKGIISKNEEHCIINVFDISKRILAEKALRKSEELNRSIILQTAMDGFWQVDIQGKILEVNETYCRMSGYSQQELLSMKVSELEAFETDTDVANHIKKVIQAGKESFETSHRRKDGSIFFVEISTQYRPEEGKFVSFLRDITDRKRNEADLIYHAGLIENVSDAIISTDVNFRIKSWNKSAEKIYGWKSEETIGKLVSEILPTEYSHDNSRDESLSLLLANGIWQGEVIQKRKDKTSVNIQASVKLLKDNNGKVIGSVSVNRDITELKKSQAILSQKENQYRSFFINNNAVILLIDPDTTEIKEANPAACRYYGWSHSELCNKSFSDISPLSKAEISINFQKTKTEKNNHLILKHRLAKGELRDVQIQLGPIQLGESILLYAIINDITEQRKANELLIESEKRYRSLFEQGNDAIFLLDLESGSYIDCNILAETLTGYTREEILNLKTGALLPPGHKNEIASNIELIVSQNVLRKETEIITKDGNLIPVEFNSSKVEINKRQCILSMLHDISDRKAVEEALKKSEERVRLKLQNILSPEGSISDLELNDIIDVPSIQQLLVNFYDLVQIPVAILDKKGQVLVGVGWQEICTKFHRAYPKSCRNCFESDTYLTKGIADGEFRMYKCKNNMWDIATPLIIGGEQKGNLFMGQFFFENEPIDIELFRKQAGKYNYAENEYLDALKKVPHLSREKIENAKSFFLNLARTISQLSYSNIKLSRAITQQKRIEEELKEKEHLLNKAQEIAQLGSWSLDLNNNILTWSDEMHHIFGVLPSEFTGTYECFLESVHPDDRNAVNTAYTNSILEGKNNYEIIHRIFRKHTGELRYVLEKCEHERDASGKIIRSVGMTHDITELKRSEEALKENERLFRESQAAASIGSYSSDLIQKTWTATPALYEIFGIDESYPNTLDAWIRSVHPDFREELIRDLLKKENSSKVFDHEYKIIRVIDGAERWVHGLGKFEFDNQMNPIGLIGTIQDITERKEKEKALHKLNRTMAALSKSSQAMSKALNEADYLKQVCKIVVEDTDFAMVWIGYAEDDEEKTIRPIASAGFNDDYIETIKLSWNDSEIGRGPTGKAIRTGKMSICNNILTDPDFEPWREQALKRGYASSIVFPLKSGDKTFGAFSIYSREPESFLDAKINLLTELAKDLAYGITTIRLREAHQLAEKALSKSHSELEALVKERTSELQTTNDLLKKEINIRKQQEQNLKMAEEKYRTIANYTFAWESWIDPNGQFVYVSPSCLRITGYTVEEFMNDPHLFFKIAHPEDRDFVEQKFYEGTSGNLPFISFDFRIITRSKEVKWLAHSCNSIFSKEGKWLGMRCSNNDITERKKVESFLVNSQDKLRALTQHMNELTENERKNIAREIHDELGHMLTALKYDIDNLMSNSELTVELVKNELPVMIGMVESLIDSVKKIATELRPGILDHLGLFPAMEWQINQFRMMTKIKCLYYSGNLDVSFDKNETTTIFRILQEILTNVARHSKANEVVISVDKKTDTFYMNISDNGIGDAVYNGKVVFKKE